MPLETTIHGAGDGRGATVSSTGALAVGPPHASLTFNATLAVDDTPANIVFARGNEGFCITGILLRANKNVSATVDAIVTIYTATSATAAKEAAVDTLFSLQVGKSESVTLTPILIESGEGLYINGETSDDDVSVVILGYYVHLR